MSTVLSVASGKARQIINLIKAPGGTGRLVWQREGRKDTFITLPSEDAPYFIVHGGTSHLERGKTDIVCDEYMKTQDVMAETVAVRLVYQSHVSAGLESYVQQCAVSRAHNQKPRAIHAKKKLPVVVANANEDVSSPPVTKSTVVPRKRHTCPDDEREEGGKDDEDAQDKRGQARRRTAMSAALADSSYALMKSPSIADDTAGAGAVREKAEDSSDSDSDSDSNGRDASGNGGRGDVDDEQRVFPEMQSEFVLRS